MTEPQNTADELARRWVRYFTAGEREKWLPMLAADQVTRDLRPLVGIDTTGIDGVAEAYPRDRSTRPMTSTVETVAVRGETFALLRWRATSGSGREWDSFHLTQWNDEGLNVLNVIFPPDQQNEALAELDSLYEQSTRGPARDSEQPR